eukprot:NODE_630_length_5208_cov_0.377178.p1 type:complete len:530 gc:universal NODE_630_length_5208_cov_0.377178:3084-1495(-)
MLFHSLVYAVSQDCPLVVQLAQDLHFDQKFPTDYQNYQNDCCTATGITCSTIEGEERVTRIDWGNLLTLDGQFQGNPFPSKLDFLTVNDNPITGPFPNNLPNSLTQFYAASTSLSGSVSNLPTNLQILSIYTCSLSGPLPILPTGIIAMYASDNKFTGDIPILPDTLQVFKVQNNLLNGTMSEFPASIFSYVANNNQLKGLIPPFVASLSALDVSQNQLTGCISSHFVGKDLRIYRNQIKGVLYVDAEIIYVQINLFTNLIIADLGRVMFCNVDSNPMGTNPYPGYCTGDVTTPTAEELAGCSVITTTLRMSSSLTLSETTETFSSQIESTSTLAASISTSDTISSSEGSSSATQSTNTEASTQKSTTEQMETSSILTSSTISTLQPSNLLSTESATSSATSSVTLQMSTSAISSAKSTNAQSTPNLSIYTVGTSHFSSIDNSASVKDGANTQNIDCEDGNGEGEEGNGGNGHQMTFTHTNMTNSTVTTDYVVIKTSPIEQKTQNAQETTKNAGNVISILWGIMGVFVI